MISGMEMMGCQDLAVPATVMRHVAHVESGTNPYAIGVVGARLRRQPRNLDEAVATARMLEANGYNFSLGIAQVNRSNLKKYGLDTHEKAFDACSNLSAGSRILAGCYASASGDWGKAFSCYYSGNFVKGFEDGYVQKLYDSISRGMIVADNGSMAIPLLPRSTSSAASQVNATAEAGAARSSSEQERIAMRSSPLKTAVRNARVPASEQSSTPLASQPGTALPRATAPEVFVPQVRSQGEPPASRLTANAAEIDQADRDQGERDSAFVF